MPELTSAALPVRLTEAVTSAAFPDGDEREPVQDLLDSVMLCWEEWAAHIPDLPSPHWLWDAPVDEALSRLCEAGPFDEAAALRCIDRLAQFDPAIRFQRRGFALALANSRLERAQAQRWLDALHALVAACAAGEVHIFGQAVLPSSSARPWTIIPPRLFAPQPTLNLANELKFNSPGQDNEEQQRRYNVRVEQRSFERWLARREGREARIEPEPPDPGTLSMWTWAQALAWIWTRNLDITRAAGSRQHPLQRFLIALAVALEKGTIDREALRCETMKDAEAMLRRELTRPDLSLIAYGRPGPSIDKAREPEAIDFFRWP
jgi:hypothetical protein